MSPFLCFVPISAQQDSEIDYRNQFRVAKTLRKPTVKRSKKRKTKKRGVKRKQKRTNASINKKLKIGIK